MTQENQDSLIGSPPTTHTHHTHTHHTHTHTHTHTHKILWLHWLDSRWLHIFIVQVVELITWRTESNNLWIFIYVYKFLTDGIWGIYVQIFVVSYHNLTAHYQMLLPLFQAIWMTWTKRKYLAMWVTRRVLKPSSNWGLGLGDIEN